MYVYILVLMYNNNWHFPVNDMYVHSLFVRTQYMQHHYSDVINHCTCTYPCPEASNHNICPHCYSLYIQPKHMQHCYTPSRQTFRTRSSPCPGWRQSQSWPQGSVSTVGTPQGPAACHCHPNHYS